MQRQPHCRQHHRYCATHRYTIVVAEQVETNGIDIHVYDTASSAPVTPGATPRRRTATCIAYLIEYAEQIDFNGYGYFYCYGFVIDSCTEFISVRLRRTKAEVRGAVLSGSLARALE